MLISGLPPAGNGANLIIILCINACIWKANRTDVLSKRNMNIHLQDCCNNQVLLLHTLTLSSTLHAQLQPACKLKMFTNIEVVSIHKALTISMNFCYNFLAICWSSLRITHLNINFIRLNVILCCHFFVDIIFVFQQTFSGCQYVLT